ncbi:hypothetical protein GQ457_03G046670 [Hibiscus cannabinus]
MRREEWQMSVLHGVRCFTVTTIRFQKGEERDDGIRFFGSSKANAIIDRRRRSFNPIHGVTVFQHGFFLESEVQESLSKPRATTFIFIALILLICAALSAAFAFAFLFYSSASSSSSATATARNFSRPLNKLEKPVVLLVSSDGFRFGYQFKTPTPNIHRLIENGTEAEMGLIPVFPSLTFPNHYSIVTGLYPAYHGIINNHFIDPKTGEFFHSASHETNEVRKGSWNCPEKLCMKYNGSVPFEDRVDTVLSYFDLPSSEIPAFMTLYFEDPDHQGHKVGPDDPQITEAVARIDRMIGRLIDGLEKRGILEDVTIIMVGDHGMMNEGLESGKVEDGKYLKVYLKEDLPSRLHYAASDRIPPIIGLIEESFKVEQNRTNRKSGEEVPSFENVQIYNLVTSILNIHGAPNNGSSAFPDSILCLDSNSHYSELNKKHIKL